MRKFNSKIEEKIIIVVPIYRKIPNDSDVISLTQLFSILGKYEINFIVPESLDVELYLKKWNVNVVRFEDAYFSGIEGYTKLLLSEQFYRYFDRFEYMLVYQTDAFVFSDRLTDFCKLGYDYIGAPIRDYGWNYYHVGNGGLSLRKISSCIEIIKKKDEILLQIDSETKNYIKEAEDLFWGYCGWNKHINFSVPSIWVASQFSAERDVGHGLRQIREKGLPFGCHHWTIMNREIWKPIIERYGYYFPEFGDDGWETLETDRIKRSELFLHHLIRHHELCGEDILENIQYSVYGAGEDGTKCVSELQNLGVKVKCIYDRSYKEKKNLLGVSVCEYKHKDKDELIIISSRKYYDEISLELMSQGLKENIDYKSYGVLFNEMRIKMESLYKGIEGITIPFNIFSKESYEKKKSTNI